MSIFARCKEALFHYAKTPRATNAAKTAGLLANIGGDAIWTYLKYQKEKYCPIPKTPGCGDTLQFWDRFLIATPLGTFTAATLIALCAAGRCQKNNKKSAAKELTKLTGCFFYLAARFAYDLFWSLHPDTDYDDLPAMDNEQLARDLALMGIEMAFMLSGPLSVCGEHLWKKCLPPETKMEEAEGLMSNPADDAIISDISGMGPS